MLKNVHAIASKGFNLQSNLYAQTRPSYPKEVLDRIQEIVVPNDKQKAKLVDLAAGTGIMTKLLVESGFKNIIAVEPLENMRRELHKAVPAIPCLDGTAWAIPVDDNSQDAMICAQAFHWFDDIQALREFHRILRPGGYGILVWNLESSERSEWVAKARSIYELYDESAPQFRKMNWRKVFDTEEAKSLFEFPYHYELFKNDYWVPKQNVAKRALTKSYISCLDKDQQDKVEAKINDIVNTVPTDDQGRVLYPHDTHLFYFQKK
ncbi:MAG: S-adenosyl-L-methionine-dependent methyltransferase [Benjaminiella poitrasii]|nr:MAG: S-adenosyl-L-methionine-dependent methyltransferase [Benjaminiella poitrasii]